MSNKPELVVMLTHHDLTVENAAEIFEQCKQSKARCWGFKEHPLPFERMRELFGCMKEAGKTTFLEVVAYSEEEGLKGAKMAAGCQCDVLMGTCYHDSILSYCQEHDIRYMPFVGRVEGRPSVLSGSIDEIVAEAQDYVRKGVYGIDLLGYRYTGDILRLNRELISSVEAPVCLAGSINSYERLKEVCEVRPWAFTIGSAFFEHRFGEGLNLQIDNVCDYINYEERRSSKLL